MADSDDVKPEDIISELDREDGVEVVNTRDWYRSLEEVREKTESMEDRENRGILTMRKWWAYCVLALITLIVLFDIVLVWKYGNGRWSFENPIVVIVVITDNFLKIFGLGFLITREIFRKIFH